MELRNNNFVIPPAELINKDRSYSSERKQTWESFWRHLSQILSHFHFYANRQWHQESNVFRCYVPHVEAIDKLLSMKDVCVGVSSWNPIDAAISTTNEHDKQFHLGCLKSKQYRNHLIERIFVRKISFKKNIKCRCRNINF